MANEQDPGIEWQECVSLKGNPYLTGRRKAAPDGEGDRAANKKANFGVQVNFEYAEAKAWKDTPQKVRDVAAINQYSLNKNDGISKYKKELNFSNTEHYHYYFMDETGDEYGCNTFTNGEHWIVYNSSKPNIIAVRGS